MIYFELGYLAQLTASSDCLKMKSYEEYLQLELKPEFKRFYSSIYRQKTITYYFCEETFIFRNVQSFCYNPKLTVFVKTGSQPSFFISSIDYCDAISHVVSSISSLIFFWGFLCVLLNFFKIFINAFIFYIPYETQGLDCVASISPDFLYSISFFPYYFYS